MLGGGFAVLQAPFVECVSFDPFSFQQDGLASSEVDIGGREVSKALVIALVIIVRDEGIDLCFEMAGQIVVLEQDAVLQGLMPAFDFALGLRMIGRPTNMIHFSVIEPFGQITRDVRGTVVRQQSRPVDHVGLIAA